MRHQLTIAEQIRGAEKALANPRTPKQFRPSLAERLEQLRARQEREGNESAQQARQQ